LWQRGFEKQTDLAQAADVPSAVIHHLARGVLPTAKHDLERIAQALLVTPSELVKKMYGFILEALKAQIEEYEPEVEEAIE